jgi:hypothetical protein
MNEWFLVKAAPTGSEPESGLDDSIVMTSLGSPILSQFTHSFHTLWQ